MEDDNLKLWDEVFKPRVNAKGKAKKYLLNCNPYYQQPHLIFRYEYLHNDGGIRAVFMDKDYNDYEYDRNGKLLRYEFEDV